MKRTFGIWGPLFLLAVCGTGAQELTVSYVEGDAQVRDGSTWAALSVGDHLLPQATVQLAGGAYLEVRRVDLKIVLSQKGLYSLRDVLAASRVLTSSGAGKALTARLSLLMSGTTRNQSSVGGARAGNKDEADDSEWMTSSAQVSLDAGKAYMKSGQYGEAIEQFRTALDTAAADEAPQVRYYLAYSHSLNGGTREALKYAADLQPIRADEWASDFIILKAKLYVDTCAFAQAIAWLTQRGHDLSGDEQRGAIYLFLLGVGYQGMGDTSNAKNKLSRVIAISGESELGKAAAQLLQSP